MNERILLIKHGGLGDLIQGFDAFESLRKSYPDAHISLLTTKPYEKMMKSSNWFDEVLIDQRTTAWNIFQTLSLKSLLQMGWDKIIDLQCSKRTATYARFVSRGTRWFGIAPNATDFMPDFTGITNRQRMLTAVCMAGATETEPDLSFLTSSGFINSISGLEHPYALILPSSSEAGKGRRWPTENYIKTAKALKSNGFQPVLSGTESDRPITAAIATEFSECLDLTGSPNLFLLAELAIGSSIVIGNDTGPVFLAARLNVPTLMLMGAGSDDSMSAPYGKKARWIKKDMLDQLVFEEVWETVKLALE